MLSRAPTGRGRICENIEIRTLRVIPLTLLCIRRSVTDQTEHRLENWLD